MTLWQRMAFLSLAYYVSAQVGTALSPEGGTAVSCWLPGGLLVSVLLLNPQRYWPWLLLAVAPANFLFDWFHDPHPDGRLIAYFYLANVLQALSGAWLVQRWVSPQPKLATLHEFFGLLFCAGIIGPALGAGIGVCALDLFGLTPDPLAAWKTWWGGNAMAVLVLAPLILTWGGLDLRSVFQRATPGRTLEALVVYGGLLAFLGHILVWGGGITSPKIPSLIFVVWAGVRFGVRGSAVMVFLLAIVASYMTVHWARGLTIEQIMAGDYVFTLQTYVAVSALVGLVPAVVLSERNRALQGLRESSKSLRATIENTPDVAVRWLDHEGRVIFWNQAAEEIYGWPAGEAVGRTLDQLMFTEEQNRNLVKVLRKVESSGKPHGPTEMCFCRRNGTYGIILSTLFQIQLPNGEAGFACMDVDLTQRKRAEALTVAEIQILEMSATGRPLAETLDALLRAMEAQAPDTLCSILLLDEDGVHMRHGAAPTLPRKYMEAIDGFPIGPAVGSCGTAAWRRSAVFVADMETDPLWAAFKHHVLPHGLRACWSTPIFDAAGNVLGTLALYRRTPGLPDESHRQLIEMGTHTAAVCIGKYRAEQKHQQATEREQKARMEYTIRLIAGQEAERKRIAAELHDSLGQNLLLIKNLAQMAARAQEPALAYDHVNSINSLAAGCIADVRQISRDLHPHQLDHLGLKRALEAMLEKAAQASPIHFSWKLDDTRDVFSPEAKMNLYRIVQESLNNILKHSQAKSVNIRLERDIHEVVLEIIDDGCGFDLAGQAASHPGMGLKNIAERVRMLGGNLVAASAPGKGSQLKVTVPIKDGGEMLDSGL